MDMDGIRDALLTVCIQHKTVASARAVVRGLTREQLVTVTCRELDDRSTLLFYAVIDNRPSLVKFLLEECYADVDQRCDVDGRESMTPLCWAARNLDIRMVRLLVEHDADVNARPEDHCTPVNSAALNDKPAIVEYLVEHSADINIPDMYGETCLMHVLANSTHPCKLAQYMIDHGASVNAVDNSGENALYYALRSQRSLRLLLRHGTDPAIINKYGDDVLQAAALQDGGTKALGFLISELQPTPHRCAELYSLVAAWEVDQWEDFGQAVHYWRKSLACRPQTAQNAPITAGPHPVYNGAVEAHDVESLEAIAGDRDALYMQALICRERILGSSHRDTIHWLSMRALHYANSTDQPTYERGMALFKYASQCCNPDSLPVFYDMRTYFDIKFLLLNRFEADATSVKFDDVADLMHLVITMSAHRSNSCSSAPSAKQAAALVSVEFIFLLERLTSSETERQRLSDLVRALVRSTRPTRKCYTIVHFAATPYVYNDLAVKVLEEVLDAGADVNAVDSYGTTPLFSALVNRCNALHDPAQRGGWLRVINLLLHRGAHVDIRDTTGLSAADLLPPEVNKIQYVTLQCLAARAVLKYNITYRGIIPTTLADSTDQH